MMRRKDRQITNTDTIKNILASADSCRIAFNDKDYPYIAALNYGYTFENGHITLYFHGAKEGRKSGLINKNGKAAFFIDTRHRLVDDNIACKMTMEFMSIYGTGSIYFINDENEKINALSLIVGKYTSFKDKTPQFSENMVKNTAVFRLDCDFFTAKGLIR